MDSFRILGYNQYQEMSAMSNSRISVSWTTLRHGLQMAGLLAAATAGGLLFRQLGFPETNIVLLYLLAVLLTAWMTRGYGYGVFASLLATLIFNYFFTAPYWSLSVDDPSYWITFIIMTATAFITSALTSKAKLNAQNALQREQEIKTMYALSRGLNEQIEIRQIARLAAEVLSSAFHCEVSCLCLDEKEQPAVLYAAQPCQAAQALPCDQFNSDTALNSAAPFTCLPLQNNGIQLARLKLPAAAMTAFSESDHQLLQSLCETLTLALDRFRSAKQKIRSEEEAAQERYRSNLLRAISHDLRTPLSAIMGTSEMILDMSEAHDPRHDLAQDIYQDADWLHSLVENILSLTRIQDGHLNLHLEKEAAEEIIASSLDHIAKRAPQRQINVSIPQEVLMIPMDGKLIQQVLINLLDNALKHTHPQDEISLTLRREQTEAVFTVRDGGEGIAEKDLAHIFQTFYTTRTRQPDAQHGIGLGLSICESIVKAHHGSISARNRTDQHGAEFTFRLPLED